MNNRPLSDEIFYHIFPRSFYDSNGDRIGDLNGIREKLDYLQDLGITALWINPLFRSQCYHNYFADDFMSLDPDFGTLADFTALCREVHRRGMKILIDMEPVYIAAGHLWYRDSIGNPSSPYSDHILYNGENNTRPESIAMNIEKLKSYDGRQIPVVTLNLDNPEVRQHITDVFLYWLDPEGKGDLSSGVDGYRLDHVMDDLDDKGIFTDLYTSFWEPIIEKVRQHRPGALFIAEQTDWNNYGADIMEKAGVDAAFTIPLIEAVREGSARKTALELKRALQQLPTGKNLLTVIENHDVTRYAESCGNNKKRLETGAWLTTLLSFVPSLYYGQEIGMTGKTDFDISNDGAHLPVREAFKWHDNLEHAGHALWYRELDFWWKKTQLGHLDSLERQRKDPDSLFSLYRKLFAIRKKYPVLLKGSMEAEVMADHVLVITRHHENDTALILVNMEEKRQRVDLSFLPQLFTGTVRNVLTGEQFPEAGEMTLELEGYGKFLFLI